MMSSENAINHRNLERELKYLVPNQCSTLLAEVAGALSSHGFKTTDHAKKLKNEEYFDDASFSYLGRGDVVRLSRHHSESGIYSHFLFKRNVSAPETPYVSKIEIGSGAFSGSSELRWV